MERKVGNIKGKGSNFHVAPDFSAFRSWFSSLAYGYWAAGQVGQALRRCRFQAGNLSRGPVGFGSVEWSRSIWVKQGELQNEHCPAAKCKGECPKFRWQKECVCTETRHFLMKIHEIGLFLAWHCRC